MRTMDAFWSGQLKSKEWLIDRLTQVISIEHNAVINCPLSVDIHGGWVGTLASMLFQSAIPIKHICSIDIDSECEDIALTMNQIELEAGKFRAVTANMCYTRSDADIIINTSFEHILQDDYKLWLLGLRQDSLIVLQTNNYSIPEHVRTASSLDEFKLQAGLGNILYAGELELPLYKRFMIIGYQ